MVEVCINYGGQNCGNEKGLVIFHREDGKWERYAAVVDTAQDIACATVPALSAFIVAQEIPVGFDILPGSCPNPFNVTWLENIDSGGGKKHAGTRKGGVLPTAIVGASDFDVNDVDVSTLLLEGVAPLRHGYEDVTSPVVDGGECACTKDGPDGFTDLTLKFSRQAIAEAMGDVGDRDVVVLKITGSMLDGRLFEAVDCVVIRSKYPDAPLVDTGGEAQLGPIVPNPFNPGVRIAYWWSGDEHVRLSIYDVSGRLVSRLVDEVQPGGWYEVEWHAGAAHGHQLASGVYFCRIQAGSYASTKKLVMLK